MTTRSTAGEYHPGYHLWVATWARSIRTMHYMSPNHSTAPTRYEIEVDATLDDRWSRWFTGMRPEPTDRATTRLLGDVLDQAQLHGVLAQIRDLGLEIVAVTRLESPAGDHHADRSDRDARSGRSGT